MTDFAADQFFQAMVWIVLVVSIAGVLIAVVPCVFVMLLVKDLRTAVKRLNKE